MRFTTWTTAVVALLPLTGCGGGEERLAISGKVLFKGEPLDQGRIDFVPPNNAGSLSGAVVENGAFSIPRDKGLLPGTYLVRVYSYDRKGAKVPDPIPGDPGAQQFRERISRKYNVDTILRAEVQKGNVAFEFKVE